MSRTPDRIVVGVDGSAAAQSALRFGLEEARLRGAPVRAVTAYDLSAMAVTALGFPLWPKLVDDLERSSRDLLDRQVEEAAKRTGSDASQVERVARRGRPSEVLLDEAQGALLLVVGSRGLEGFTGLVLGSVSQAVAAHSPCPVTIVRSRAQRRRAQTKASST
jgi:nucleotide-binding universal stress UspA family protein